MPTQHVPQLLLQLWRCCYISLHPMDNEISLRKELQYHIHEARGLLEVEEASERISLLKWLHEVQHCNSLQQST
jgi:hypothetical protein